MQGAEQHITKFTLLDKKNIHCVHERRTKCYKTGIGHKKDLQEIFKNWTKWTKE